MARRRVFVKDVTKYMGLGNSGLGALLSGLSAFSAHALIRINSVSAGVNDNNILGVIASGTTGGFALSIDGTVTKLRCSSRSVSTDARQALTGGTALVIGTDYYVGVAVDIGGKTITLYVAGVADGTVGALAYANAVWTLGVPTDVDAVGGFQGPPPSTSVQFDGLIGELALYNVALTAGNFATLATGAAPSSIAGLIWNLPDNGTASPELATTGGVNGTITGDLPIYPPIERLTRGMRVAA